MEFNPALSNKEYLTQIKSFGVNRISIGVQSFQENILKTLNRLHTKQEALQMINWAQTIGFKSHSIDLIYGIFGQTEQALKQDLKILKSLNIPHISTYGLKIEEGTPFEKFDKSNLPTEETCEKMYLLISNSLEEIDYTHYEISNFSKENHQSQHNLTYWHNEEYLGIGPSAHSFLDGKRFYYGRDFQAFMNGVSPIDDGFGGDFTEYAMLNLRLVEGLNESKVLERFGHKIQQELYKKSQIFIDNGYMTENNNGLALTRKGFLLSNTILSEIL